VAQLLVQQVASASRWKETQRGCSLNGEGEAPFYASFGVAQRRSAGSKVIHRYISHSLARNARRDRMLQPLNVLSSPRPPSVSSLGLTSSVPTAKGVR
jgi:hypothetical protein